MDTKSKTDDFICLLFNVLSLLRAAFAMPATSRSILMNGTVNVSVFGPLEKYPFPSVVFIIHCAFMAGRRPPRRKKGWVPSHQCIGTHNLSVMLYTWNISFCLCQ
ncbi:hypothetical protein BAE44_0005317 [Dichanthelium oligosanthes]|uniref:Secreted protein n=1 Tax=Dichanthelium oligosanthes TaxID=888268 RepID=A0A1E5W8C8_9POAL|nr:hypothetical protein BAE44_0005317 [Dichanthelium oligosanthes]